MTHSFAHLTLTLLLHYLVKCRSRILAVNNSECILVAHASAPNIIARPQIIENLLLPGWLHRVECALQASLSYQDLERWRTETTHQQQMGRSASRGHLTCCRRVASAFIRLRSCWRRTFEHTWCDVTSRWCDVTRVTFSETVTASRVCRKCTLIIALTA